MTCFSLRELIVDARLGGATVGMSHSDVREQLGAPDDWGIYPKTVERAEIWRYGNFEVHFGDDGRCWMLFNDYVARGLDAGPGRTLDLWIFADNPDLATAAARLRTEGLSVDEALNHDDLRQLRVRTTTLSFDDDRLAVLTTKA